MLAGQVDLILEFLGRAPAGDLPSGTASRSVQAGRACLTVFAAAAVPR
jgi:hypothetical protein